MATEPVLAIAELDRGEHLVAEAHALLEAEGLEGLTIRALLARTGLSRRAVYERFPGKDDLVLAVFAYVIRAAAGHFGELVAATADPLARLEAIVTGIVLGRSAFGDADGSRLGIAMSREHLRLAEQRPVELRAALEPLIGLIAAQIAAGIAAGTVRDAPPERLAALVYDLVSTTVHRELIAPERATSPTDLAQLAREVWDFCRHAIAA